MTSPTVHVLLVHYNTPDLLDGCIRSVLRSPQAEVHVIDNDSRPEAYGAVEAAWNGEPRVHLHRSRVNLGFGGGVNALARGLTGDEDSLLWILNPDTVAEPGALETLSGVLTAGLLDVVSPVLTTGPSGARTIWFAGGDVNRAGRVVHHHQGEPVPDVPRPLLRRCNFLTGAAPMMSASTWREVGELREELFLYWEDVEWCMRAVARGKRLGVAGDAEVWHAVGRASATSGKAPAYYYYNVRNRIVACGGRTSLSRVVFAALTSLETVRLLARALRQPGRRVAGARMVGLGLLHGLRGATGPARS